MPSPWLVSAPSASTTACTPLNCHWPLNCISRSHSSVPHYSRVLPTATKTTGFLNAQLCDRCYPMAPKNKSGGDKKGKGKADKAVEDKSGGGKVKGAQQINVRHILVSSCYLLYS